MAVFPFSEKPGIESPSIALAKRPAVIKSAAQRASVAMCILLNAGAIKEMVIAETPRGDLRSARSRPRVTVLVLMPNGEVL